VVVAAAVIALFAWSPWVEPTETEWLGAYEAWSDGVGQSLATGVTVSRPTCEATFDGEVGGPPTERLEPLARAARRVCADLSRSGWESNQSDVVRELLAVHSDLAPPRQRGDISEIPHSSVGVRPNVYCWQPEAWAQFLPHHALVRGGEVVSLKGIADVARDRIDLDPAVCATLSRYRARVRPSPLTYQNFELAEALAIVTHQAERLKTPAASEADLECYAVQHVRPLVDAVWGPAFAEEIALHAWEISYRQLPPSFRTPDCRDGRRLDRTPDSTAWP
jgi:hypothetical protein